MNLPGPEKATILFLFNSSDYAVRPWLDDGRYNVVSVDWHTTDHSAAHRPHCDHLRLNVDLSQPDATARVLELLWAHSIARPCLVVSFPCCTHLAVSGARHFKAKLAADPDIQNRAVRMARLASEFDCAYVIENPVSVLATMWRKPDVYVHPWQLSYMYDRHDIEGAHPEFPDVIPAYDWYNKKTCLWTGGGFTMPWLDDGAGPTTVNPGWAKLGGKSARTKYIRSLTPRSLAYGIYDANCDIGHKKVVDKEFLVRILRERT